MLKRALERYELQPGIYNFEDLSKALFNIFPSEYPSSNSEIVIEFDDITRKTKLVVRPGIIAKRFDKKSFFSTILGFLQVGIMNSIMNTLARKL